MTKTAKAAVAFVLALALLALKAIGPTLATTQVRLLPVNESLQITSETAEATLFDAAAWNNRTPVVESADCNANLGLECFLTHPRVSTSKTITAWEGDTAKEAHYEVDESLATDTGQDLFTAHDDVRLIRHSSFPVDKPLASLKSESILPGFSHDSSEQVRDGLQYSFPFATEFRSYRYFDKYSATTTPIDFHDRETMRGVTVYRFHQKIAPVQLHIGTIKGRASQFYSPEEISALGLAAGNTVVMNQYYTMTRTLWVEPKTGTIVDSVEIPHIFLARDAVEAQQVTTDSKLTLFKATLRWNEPTTTTMWDRALKGLRTLKAVTVGLLAATIGSAALIVLGIYYLRRRD